LLSEDRKSWLAGQSADARFDQGQAGHSAGAESVPFTDLGG
jgi:hypothetical protein